MCNKIVFSSLVEKNKTRKSGRGVLFARRRRFARALEQRRKTQRKRKQRVEKVWRKTDLFLCSADRRTLMAMAHQDKSDNKKYHVNHISKLSYHSVFTNEVTQTTRSLASFRLVPWLFRPKIKKARLLKLFLRLQLKTYFQKDVE